MKKDWKSKVTEAILARETDKAKEVNLALSWIENFYNFKRKEEMKKIIPGYVLKSEKYQGNKIKMEFICNKNHLFKMRWNNIVTGQRCPYCNIYKNEEECRQILEKITGKKFEKVRPDFLINPKTNSRLELDGYCKDFKLAFEYDGKQHYEPVEHLGGAKAFADLQKNDTVKNELCKKMVLN